MRPRRHPARQAVLRVIEAWQANPVRPRGMCLHTPTCSAYGHRAVSRHGLVIGGIMTAWRVIRCNPYLSGARPGLKRARQPVSARAPGKRG